VETLNSVIKKANEFWTGIEKKKRIMFITIAAVAVVIIFSLVFFLNRTQYAVLYTNLDPKDAGEILSRLNEDNIDAKPQGADTILVPKKDVDRLRMQLATEGYPKSTLSLDIFQKGSGFGTTEEDKQVYKQYQLQEHLQNAIKTFDGVVDARVYLTMPKESAFVLSDEQKNATAAVLLTLEHGKNLSSDNVKAISQFVQKSVQNLKPEDITIVDSNMNVLSYEDDNEETNFSNKFEMEKKIEEKLKSQVNNLLQPVFGVGKVIAEVNVTLDFDDKVTNTVKFEPIEGSSTGVIASIDSLREQIVGGDNAGGIPGLDSNGGAPTYPVVDTENSVYQKNAEKINYEVNTIKEQIIKEKGQIKDLSVSVIIDSNEFKDDYSENIKNLVSNAVGVSKDYISVEALPFNGSQSLKEAIENQKTLDQMMQDNKMKQFYIMLAIIILVILISSFILVKLIKAKKETIEENDRFEIPEFPPVEDTSLDGSIEPNKDAQNIKKIEEKIDSTPELVANIIRSWISDEG